MATDDLDELLIEPRQGGARPGLPVDPGRLWLSVRRDWRWLPVAGGVWLALGLIVAFVFIKHTYKAEAILVWEPKTPTGMSPDDRVLATEAGSMKLQGALRQVKQRLKLGITTEALGKMIDVWFDTRSNLVTVEASGASAADSTRLTTTVINVFLDQQRFLARVRAEESSKTLQSDLATEKKRLQEARSAFDTFRTHNNVSDVDKETTLALDNVARLKQEQQTAHAEVLSLTARVDELTSQAKNQPRNTVQSASSTNPEAEKLAGLRTELATAKARYSEGHPRIGALQAQIAALQARSSKNQSIVSSVTTGANPEFTTVSTSLSQTRADLESAQKRVISYDEYVKQADDRVTSLSAIQGQAHSLRADIEGSEKRITDLESALSEARAAASIPQLDWRVLTPAAEPDWPVRSKRRIIVAGMPIAGVLVALLALLLRPLLDGRIYTAREAAYWANLPVIGSSAWPRNSEMFFTLVDELGDQGAGARGYTLVLGATGREKQLAEELAYWLGGGALSGRRRDQVPTARVEFTHAHAQAHVSEAPSASAAGGGELHGAVTRVAGSGGATVVQSEALVPMQRHGGGSALSPYPEGTHVWLGATEGPALRRAARMADRVIVLLTSGAEVFTVVAGLRTRLGRDKGVGLVLLGLSPELLKLPDRVGDVDGFWRQAQTRPRAAMG
jgi:uncharacterized protein involved in exopolysaccharide biosynthesis